MGEYTDIGSMSSSLPRGTGQLSQADDHMRGIKTALKNTFPNVLGVVNATTAELNSLVGYTGGVDIEERFTDLEAYFAYTGTKMTVAQMAMLWDLTTNQTVENRLSEVEDKLLNVSQAEVNGLDGYDIAKGYIEERLTTNNSDLNTLDAKIEAVDDRVDNVGAWINDREIACGRQSLVAVNDFLSKNYGPEYVNQLGIDFQTLVDKVAHLEFLQGGGYNTGIVTWKNYFTNLLQGQGGINVTNTLNSKDRFGFIFEGLMVGSTVDFWFRVGGIDGPRCSTINDGAKVVRVSGTGKAYVDISIGGQSDEYMPGGGRIAGGQTGELWIEGFILNPANQIGYPMQQSVGVQFYDDPQVVDPV